MLKEHKKLYKAGKNWLTATITVTALTLIGGVNARADSNNTNDDSSTQVSSTSQVSSISNDKEQPIQQTAVDINPKNDTVQNSNSETNSISSTVTPVVAESNSSQKIEDDRSTPLNNNDNQLNNLQILSLSNQSNLADITSLKESNNLADPNKGHINDIAHSGDGKQDKNIIEKHFDNHGNELLTYYYFNNYSEPFAYYSHTSAIRNFELVDPETQVIRTVNFDEVDFNRWITVDTTHNKVVAFGPWVVAAWSKDMFPEYQIPQIKGYISYLDMNPTTVAKEKKGVTVHDSRRHRITYSKIISSTKEQKIIVRNILINTPGKDSKKITQNVQFYRNVLKNEEGNKIYGEWMIDQNSNDKWPSYVVPQYNGYTSISEKKNIELIPEKKININTKNEEVVVDYIKKKDNFEKNGSINYVDLTGKIVKTDTISGKIGDNVKVIISLPDGYELANKDEQLPSTVPVTEDGIQTVIVNVKKIPVTVSGYINYVDENGKVIKTDTVSGVVGTSIPVKIEIPDGYELANKDEQLPTTIKIDNNQLQDLTIKVKKIASPSQSADNQVPQDHTTQNNQLNFNQGWLDNYGLTQTKDGQSQIKASGWHVAGQSNQDSYRYMIVYDNTLGHEVARQKLTPVVRNDVRRAYSNVNNSNYSGFDMTIDIPTSTINHSLSLVARYSNDAVNGEGQHVDYWFGPLKMDDSNQGYLDSIKSDGKTVTVSGWHATNQAANRPYHYIIAFDQTLGHEIARQKVESVQRPDVAKVYGKIANAINSGYSTKFNLTSQYFNDNIQFLSRWTDDPNGNGNSVDYWFNPVNRINRANLDSVDLSSGELKVAGWHATDMSEFEPNHFLIVFDNTTGQQVASQKVELESSVDVAKVYSDTRTANHSRFNFNFGALNLQPGHNYSLVSRYSTDDNGNGNDGAHTDSWLNMGIFSQKAHNLDSTVLNGNTLTFQGWMADDQATIKQYPYAILLQNGKEIARQQLDLTTRPDVAKVYPRLYQSKKSGFNASFKLPTVSLDNLQLVLRYTDSKDGNGNPSDTWININHGMIKKI